MSGPPWWYDDPKSWDGMRVGRRGVFAPGIVESIRVSRPRKVDTKTGPGVNSATLTFQGYELAKVSIVMKMWTPKHWEMFQLFCAEFEPSASSYKTPTPHDFVHPALDVRGIRALLVTDIDGPSMPDAQGLVRYTVEALQFAPPPSKTATSTPATSKAAVASMGNALNPTAQEFGPPTPPQFKTPPSATPPKP